MSEPNQKMRSDGLSTNLTKVKLSLLCVNSVVDNQVCGLKFKEKIELFKK